MAEGLQGRLRRRKSVSGPRNWCIWVEKENKSSAFVVLAAVFSSATLDYGM
jgi:hypothetical protein